MSRMMWTSFAEEVLSCAAKVLEPGASQAERVFAARAVVALLDRLSGAHIPTVLRILASAPPETLPLDDLESGLERFTRADPSLTRVVEDLLATSIAVEKKLKV